MLIYNSFPMLRGSDVHWPSLPFFVAMGDVSSPYPPLANGVSWVSRWAFSNLLHAPCHRFPHTPFFYFIQILCNSVT
nr:MAG TPA: hypothetical protein [Caudoviricetes sp.]